MNDTLLHSWWLLALRGVLTILFGAAAILWPAMTLVTLAALFAAFALLAGVVWIYGALRNRSIDKRWWVLLLLGMFSVGVGVVAILYPALTTLALIILVGANALVTGVVDILVALRVRKHIKGELLLVLNGIASIVFGAVVLWFPQGAGALALAWLIGVYAILTGAMLLVLSFNVRAWSRINAPRSSPSAGAS
jgi:uncharacterized membrane protein HdeD (DUF308 family)